MNKLPWFVHRNDAQEDQFHQDLIDTFGMAGYGMWWALTECFDRQGVGDWWQTSPQYLTRRLHSQWPRLVSFLNWIAQRDRLKFRASWTKVGQEFGKSPTLSQLCLNSAQTELGISLPKFREIQAKLKGKTPPILLKSGEIEKEKEREIEKQHPSAPPRKPADPSEPTFSPAFNAFWTAYPRKTGKLKAWQSWSRLKLDKRVAEVVSAVRAQARTPQWLKMNGQYIPHPTTWLNQGRWMDASEYSVDEAVQDGLTATERWLKKTGGSK